MPINYIYTHCIFYQLFLDPSMEYLELLRHIPRIQQLYKTGTGFMEVQMDLTLEGTLFS